MKFTVDILNIDTGETRKHEHDIGDLPDAVHLCQFMWEEGNYSCDCNRSRDFFRAGAGNSDASEYEIDSVAPCGDEKYLMTSIKDESGKEIYHEYLDEKGYKKGRCNDDNYV